MNVYEDIMKGLTEAIEYERGNGKARVDTWELKDDGTWVRESNVEDKKNSPLDKR